MVAGPGTLGGVVSQEAEFSVRLVDSVGEIRQICSSEEGVPDANLFGPINPPGNGVPSHPRMQPVKVRSCKCESLFSAFFISGQA